MEIGLEQRLPVVTRCRENKTKADGSPNCPSRRSADAHFASLYTTLPHFLLRYREIYGGHLFCMQASICMHRFLVNFIWVGMEIWRERRTQPITMISTVQKGFYGMQIHWKDCCWQKMLDTPQKLGFIFLCPSGKMPSSHAIKMTHAGMTRCVLLSCLDGLMLCVSVSVQLWHLSHRNPFHYSPTEERATH